MSDRDKSKEQLIEELAALRREAAALKITKQAFDAQNELTTSLLQLVRYLISTITAFSKPVLKRICSH
ncbi:MAG: diguanylate cyclase, partial [Hormoscilla sp. SP12CHS1]|nr:diguanylate cyclase [Hormoscilla sp. SP12CHS1]